MKRSKSSLVPKQPSASLRRSTQANKRVSNAQTGARRRVTKSSSNANENNASSPGKTTVRYQPQPADGQLSNLSPEEDWRLWWKAPQTIRHNTWETEAEKDQKRGLVQHVISSFPRVPHQLDAARLRAVVSDLKISFRIACLLPALLLTDDTSKLEHLGDDIIRSIQLFRLQLELASNAILPPETTFHRAGEAGAADLARESFETSESEIEMRTSGSLVEIDKESSAAVPFVDFDGALYSFKETFHTLCLAFRDSCNYDLLTKAERIFGQSLEDAPMWPLVHEFRDLTTNVMNILAEGLQSTPFDTREVQKVTDQMTETTKTAESNKRLLRKDYESVMTKYRTEQQTLARSIKRGEQVIGSRLSELQEARAKAQTKVRRQVGDDTKPHEGRLARLQNDITDTGTFITEQNKERYLLEKARMAQLRDQGALMAVAEKDVLENCVQLKTEMIALMERREMLETILIKIKEEEQSAEKEMIELAGDRQERDERRRRAEAEALRRHKAAIVIQKWWRGYKVRKMLKKGKKKSKGKGKKGKGKSKKPATPAKAKGKSKK